jgi:predicted RNA-binding Zn-ribbon protein involved in translation (DUF1610 family)
MAGTSLRGNNGSTDDRGLNQAFAAGSEIGAASGSHVSDAHLIKFQCPQCGYELEQSIQSLKQSAHMCCRGCGVGINIDTNRLANAAEEVRRALEKVPPEITIKFFR